MSYMLNIESSKSTLDDLFKTYDVKNFDNLTIALKSEIKIMNKIKKQLNYENRSIISFEDVKIGDYIKISYCTDSQKDLEYYESKNICGFVIYIDSHNEDIIMIEIDNSGNFIFNSMNQLGCSYYGTSKGYTPMILKLI